MLEQLTSAELSEWEAYDRLEPVCPDWRADYRLAYMSALLINTANRIYGKPGAKPINPEDVMLTWGVGILEKEDQAEYVQPLEEMKKAIMEIYNAFGVSKKDKRPGGNPIPTKPNKTPLKT